MNLKSVLEKTRDTFWKLKEVRHRALRVRGFHNKRWALRPTTFSGFTTGHQRAEYREGQFCILKATLRNPVFF